MHSVAIAIAAVAVVVATASIINNSRNIEASTPLQYTQRERETDGHLYNQTNEYDGNSTRPGPAPLFIPLFLQFFF